MSEQELELPKGWSSCKIDDVCKIIRGITFPKTAKTTEKLNDHIPCLRTTNVQESTDWKNLIYIPSKYVKDESKLVKISDILISNSNSLDLVGKVSYVDQIIKNSTFGGFITIIRSHSCDSKYLFYQLRSSQIKNYFRGIASTTTNISNISTSKIADTEIFIPPLNEQKRIVAKIEELFSLVNSAKDTLEKTKILLKQYRQSILKHAFEGRLTEEWRKGHSISNSRCRWDLKDDTIENDNLPNIPSNWCWRKLEEISNGVVVSFVGTVSNYFVDKDVGIPFLRSQNVRKGKIDLKNLKFVNKSFHDREKKSQLKPNNLLIVRVGANRGDSCIVPSSLSIANSGNIIIAKIFEDIAPLLNYYFQSQFCQKQLLAMTTGSAQGVINTKSVAQTLIPIPSIEEQKQIISLIEESFSLIDKNEKIVDELLLQCNQIKNSILKHAFEGKLVPQDPNDESAEILLQRIREEKKHGK